jgi:hypothetical protein
MFGDSPGNIGRNSRIQRLIRAAEDIDMPCRFIVGEILFHECLPGARYFAMFQLLFLYDAAQRMFSVFFRSTKFHEIRQLLV